MPIEDATMHQQKMAFVVGHTSRTGKALVNELLKRNAFRKLVLVGRREVPLEGDLYKNVVRLSFRHLGKPFPVSSFDALTRRA